MLRSELFCLFIVIFLLVTSYGEEKNMEIGKNYEGFILKETRFVKELDSDCFLFEHEKTGARLLKVANSDDNKTFTISFKTPPATDKGIPHIIEHSVLNGSKNFPVKSPFDILMQGSLNTFINALTASDRTMYPVSSQNDKDFTNLARVYLDAVFFPRLLEDERIFYQEGWHRELDSLNGDITYKGVVYNEMKGAFSSPDRYLNYYTAKYLFPDNCYGQESGGHPSAISKLSYDEFKTFYQTYYHPSNSYIFLYGDGNLVEELKFINDDYLSQFEKKNIDSSIPLQKPFEKKKEILEHYPLSNQESLENNTFLSLNFVCGEGIDRNLVMGMEALSTLLVDLPAAPIREALREAGIGQDVYSTFSDEKQNTLSIVATKANQEDSEKFKEIVYETLKKVAKEGLDKREIEGVINRTEFNLREGAQSSSFPKAVIDNYRALTGWMFADNPFLSLEYESPLKNLKKALNEPYLENLIKTRLLENTHVLHLTLAPEKGLDTKINEETKKELAEYKKSLSQEELEKLVKTTQELKAYQQEPDSPEALATIPMLALSDIGKKAKIYEITEKKVENNRVLHYPVFTNHIVYYQLLFDATVLPKELIPYASLLSALLGEMNTENFSYGDLNTEINIHTGGIGYSLSSYPNYKKHGEFQPFFKVSAKVMADKTNELTKLCEEILLNTQWDDTERLKHKLTEIKAGQDSWLKNNGVYVAMSRLYSYISQSGKYDEMTSGLEYCRFIDSVYQLIENNPKIVSQNLKKTANLLFNKDYLTFGVTCADKEYPVVEKEMKTILKKLDSASEKPQKYELSLNAPGEGLMAASKVQYVFLGADYQKLGYEYNGSLKVLKQVVSRDYLHEKIRVLGGAYGAFSGFGKSGLAFFGSYRDPNLKKTIENYQNIPSYIDSLDLNEKQLTRFIIGTIAGMDKPLLPKEKGAQAISNFLTNTSADKIQAERDQVLATKNTDLKKYSEMIKKILSRNIISVYGNEDKIKENESIFNSIIPVIN